MRRPYLLISMGRHLLRSPMIGALTLIALAFPATAGAAPPANDYFANATTVGALPFADTKNLFTASTEPGEPSPSCFSAGNTAWYSFTPRKTQWVTVTTDVYQAGIAAYKGPSLPRLSNPL